VIPFGIALAILGPLLLAAVGEWRSRSGPEPLGEYLAAQGTLVALSAAVTWIGLERLGWSPSDLGFRSLGWRSLGLGVLLALFFVRVFGPATYAALRRLRARGFERGLAKLDAYPTWTLVLAV